MLDWYIAVLAWADPEWRTFRPNNFDQRVNTREVSQQKAKSCRGGNGPISHPLWIVVKYVDRISTSILPCYMKVSLLLVFLSHSQLIRHSLSFIYPKIFTFYDSSCWILDFLKLWTLQLSAALMYLKKTTVTIQNMSWLITSRISFTQYIIIWLRLLKAIDGRKYW